MSDSRHTQRLGVAKTGESNMTITERKARGYTEAARINKALHAVKEQYSVDEYPWLWLALARTLRTTVDLLESEAKPRRTS